MNGSKDRFVAAPPKAHVVTDGLATMAMVVGNQETDDPNIGFGTARCNPSDVYDQDVGVTMALGRAYRDLGQQLVKEARDHSNLLNRDRDKNKAARHEGRVRRARQVAETLGENPVRAAIRVRLAELNAPHPDTKSPDCEHTFLDHVENAFNGDRGLMGLALLSRVLGVDFIDGLIDLAREVDTGEEQESASGDDEASDCGHTDAEHEAMFGKGGGGIKGLLKDIFGDRAEVFDLGDPETVIPADLPDEVKDFLESLRPGSEQVIFSDPEPVKDEVGFRRGRDAQQECAESEEGHVFDTEDGSYGTCTKCSLTVNPPAYAADDSAL